MELNLSRQSKLVPEEALSRINFEIFGIGSIGSHVVKLLAKTGFKNIKVYDMDEVEEENLGPQAFNFSHLKMTKVDAIKQIVKEESGIDIEGIHGQVDETTEISLEPDTMYLCFFDSVEGRKLMFDKIKDMPCIFVDGRIGKYNMSHFLVDCSDDEEKNEYLQTLPKGEGSDLECGEKASAFINYTITGLIVSNIISFITEKEYTKRYMGHALEHRSDIEIKRVRQINTTPEEEAEAQPEEIGVRLVSFNTSSTLNNTIRYGMATYR